MYTQSSQSLKRFGSNGVILRSQGHELLSREQIAQHVPSVFAETKHSSRSDKYTYIPTHELLVAMAREGFHPSEVRQGGSRIEEKRQFTKHLIRFRQQAIQDMTLGDTYPEVILINSHDGTSSYVVMSGWFRLACYNGLVVAEDNGRSIKVPHRGDASDVIEASYEIVKDFAPQREQIREFQHLQLSGPEQVVFAESAAALRFDESLEVSPARVLAPNRRGDEGNSLWLTLNRVQENLVRGGVRTERTNEEGRTLRRRSREVSSISDNVRLNQALWQLATKMQELKQAA